IRSIRFDGRVVWVDRDRAVVSLTLPDHFGAATFEEGSVTRFLAADRVPPRTEVTDPLGFASGALPYNLHLGPKGPAEGRVARYQAPHGKVPCCVDQRGADRVSEHDSPGAFVYAVAEYYRYTHDVGFLHDMWPHVLGAVDYLAALREQSMGDDFKAPDKAAFHAILPASISHEGYAAYPVHSYWDDFFALRGLKDAADMARVVGDETRTAKLAALRDAFREALYASIRRTIAQHGIDFLPGSAELGDFDPTSTSVALAPAGEIGNLPEPALTRTFDRYWGEFEARRHGDTDWEEYSPYELRNVGAFVRLGEKQRALELLDALLADQRPQAWNQWSEILWRDREAPRFIGDMPHTWVGATFVRAVRMMLAYERESDQALVLAAGVPAAWATAEQGISVKR